jgi:hypothetical protein
VAVWSFTPSNTHRVVVSSDQSQDHRENLGDAMCNFSGSIALGGKLVSCSADFADLGVEGSAYTDVLSIGFISTTTAMCSECIYILLSLKESEKH